MSILAHVFGGQVTPEGQEGWTSLLSNPFFSSSGKQITEETSLQCSAVYACVKLLSETVASLPIGVYRRYEDGTKESLINHPLSRLLRYQPNEYQTSFEWRELLQAHIGLRGGGYAVKNINALGQIESLFPICSPVEAYWENERIKYKFKQEESDGRIVEYNFDQSQLLRVRGFGTNLLKPLNPIEAHRDAIGASISAADYGNRFFKNDATPRGILTHPTQFKDQEAIERFKTSWRRAQGGGNQHSTAVLENGITYTQTGMTNEDAQFLETRKYSVSEIARIFRIPPHMIGDLERSTNNNIEHQGIEFVVHTIRPWLTRWEQAIKRDLIVEDDIFVEFNVDGLLRGDTKTRYEAYGMGIRDGHMTRNEVRKLENRNPIEGLDEVLTPMNMDNSRESDLENNAISTVVNKEAALIKTCPTSESLAVALGNHGKYLKRILCIDDDKAIQIIEGLDELYNEESLSDFKAVRTAQIKEVLKCTTTS